MHMRTVEFPSVNQIKIGNDLFTRVRREIAYSIDENIKSTMLEATYIAKDGTASNLAVLCSRGTFLAVQKQTKGRNYYYVNSSFLAAARNCGYDW